MVSIFKSSEQFCKVFLSPLYRLQHQGSDLLTRPTDNLKFILPKHLNKWATTLLQRQALRPRDSKWLTQGHTAPKPEPRSWLLLRPQSRSSPFPKPLSPGMQTHKEYSQLTPASHSSSEKSTIQMTQRFCRPPWLGKWNKSWDEILSSLL